MIYQKKQRDSSVLSGQQIVSTAVKYIIIDHTFYASGKLQYATTITCYNLATAIKHCSKLKLCEGRVGVLTMLLLLVATG